MVISERGITGSGGYLSSSDWRSTSSLYQLGPSLPSRWVPQPRPQAVVPVPGPIVIGVADAVPPWIPSVATKLEELLNLPFNWDGYRAQSTQPRSALNVLLLLIDLLDDLSPAPSLVPTSSGGIQLEWHRRGIDLEIEIQPNGQGVVFFQDRRTGDEWEGDLAQKRDDLKRVIHLLSRPE